LIDFRPATAGQAPASANYGQDSRECNALLCLHPFSLTVEESGRHAPSDTAASSAVIVNRTFATEVLRGPPHAALGTR